MATRTPIPLDALSVGDTVRIAYKAICHGGAMYSAQSDGEYIGIQKVNRVYHLVLDREPEQHSIETRRIERIRIVKPGARSKLLAASVAVWEGKMDEIRDRLDAEDCFGA